MVPTPLQAQSAAQALLSSLGPHINEAVTGDLEPEFKYEYEEPSNAYYELLALLPHAIQTRHHPLTDRTKRAILHRVVLRDLESLTRFFAMIIKSPRCAWHVNELHCHVDLSSHTSGARLSRDITSVSRLADHIDRCPISLDLLIAMKDHLAREVNDRPYSEQIDFRFRQAMFISLLGHLPFLHTLRMTIHGRAYPNLSWLCAAIQRHYPVPFAENLPCHHLCPSLHKLTFHPAASYHPARLWHPFALWPLIGLPGVAELEIEHNLATWTAPNARVLNTQYDSSKITDESLHKDSHLYRTCTRLSTQRLKHLPVALFPTLYRLFSSFKALHTLAIYGSTILPPRAPSSGAGTGSGSGGVGTNINLNTLLSLPNISNTLLNLSLDIDTEIAVDTNLAQEDGTSTPTQTPTASATPPLTAPFGSAGALTSECLTSLHVLQWLYTPWSAIFHAGMVVVLPPNLVRLEVVEDATCAPSGTRSGELELLKGMRGLIQECGEGRYPELREVVLWVRSEDSGWGDEDEEDEVMAGFGAVGVLFGWRVYEKWAEGRVGGWREIGELGGCWVRGEVGGLDAE